MTTAQARQEVQALLDTCLTYDERAVMSSSGKPFLEYLLTINPRGYSVQYATLTTLLMRCCGIPARYVEGYLLPQRQIEGAEPGEALVLTQENSHAWTEIYLDGVGWIPFDTTPNHKEEITYAMPTGGGSQELSGLSQTEPVLSQTQQREIPIQQERRPDTGSDSGELPIWLLWMLPALVLLLLATRALLLRGRLRRRIQAFSTGETRRPAWIVCATPGRFCCTWVCRRETCPSPGGGRRSPHSSPRWKKKRWKPHWPWERSFASATTGPQSPTGGRRWRPWMRFCAVGMGVLPGPSVFGPGGYSVSLSSHYIEGGAI